MEFCDKHNGAHVYYDYHRTWQADCPLCEARSKIDELVGEIEGLTSTLDDLRDRLSEMETDAVVVAEHYEKRIAALETEVSGLREMLEDAATDAP